MAVLSPLSLVTRTGCHLCEEAEDLLALHAPFCRLIDVDGEELLREAYGLRVPVLITGDTVLLEGRIAEPDLLRVLASLR